MSLTLGPQIATLFILVFARVGTMVMLMPSLGERILPGRIRLSLALFLTLAMMPMLQPLLPSAISRPDAARAILPLETAVDSLVFGHPRVLAEENGVPVVENPPLARALYKAVDLDQEIPVEHYKAVAEVIGYVMRFRRRACDGCGRGNDKRRRQVMRRRTAGPRGRVDRSQRSGSAALLLVLAGVLVGAAIALSLLASEKAQPLIIGLLALLAVVGVFALFAGAVGIIEFSGRAAATT